MGTYRGSIGVGSTMSVSVPQMVGNAGTYSLRWEAESIRILIDRVDDEKGRTSGEVTIKYKPPEADDFQHLHQARLNLTSTRERNSLAKYLSERREEIDWASVLEQACVLTLRKHREGEPLQTVGNHPVSERPKYLSYPLLLANQPNMIFGDKGTAKSTLAAMTALQSGANTLWLDFEWDQPSVNDLIKPLKEGMGLSPDMFLHYRFCTQSVADDIIAIQKMVLEVQATLVVVDSVGVACGGDPMLPDVVLRYFSALRSLRVTTLSLDHVAKEARGPFGSVYKQACARNIWETIKGSQELDHLSIGLHHRKQNNGPLLKPIGFTFTYTPDSITPQKTDARTIPEVLAGMALADQIEAALSRGPMTPAELAEEIGSKATIISTTIGRHKSKFVSLGNGKWGNKSLNQELNL